MSHYTRFDSYTKMGLSHRLAFDLCVGVLMGEFVGMQRTLAATLVSSSITMGYK
jgi:hypothetical protein